MIVVSHTHPFLRFPKSKAISVIKKVYKGEKVTSVPTVSVVFTTDKQILALNKKYLRHNYITDIITFSLIDNISPEVEMYINLDAARRQAKEYGVPFQHEVQRLIIHGILHTVGYDDKNSKERSIMHQRENIYLS